MPFSAFSRSRRSPQRGLRRSSTPTPAPAESLTAQDVALLYETTLGRTPSPEEIAHQLANGATLRGLLAMIANSEERRVREAAPRAEGPSPVAVTPAPQLPPVVNVYTEELEPFGIPPGTWSADGVAVTGRRGWVFLGGGTNAILDQYRGLITLPEDLDTRWAQAMEVRRRGAQELGAAFVALIVPDKLPVLAADFPDVLPGVAQAPAAVLAARPELGLHYPVAELAAVPEGAYLRTDTHLSFAGNAALADVVGAALGVAVPHEPTPGQRHRYVMSGDLGSRYTPPIVEVVSGPTDFGAAEQIWCNRPEIAATGVHLGTRQVLRNERAVDTRTAVIFGDSYGFSAGNYQGLSWFLAQVFREVHFLWVPFGWDPDYAAQVGAEVVVCEGAERFTIRPPEPQVDVRALEADALARIAGATPPA